VIQVAGSSVGPFIQVEAPVSSGRRVPTPPSDKKGGQMSDQHSVWKSGEDVQLLENALADSSLEPRTRRTLVERAGLTLLGFGGAGALLTACGGSSKKKNTTHAPSSATEIGHPSATGVSKFVEVLKAANAAEYDHYKALKSLGAKPITTKFWAPDAFFKPGEPFKVLEIAETLFVDAYLIAATSFAQAGEPSLARYAGEIGGVEAQHLALARFAQNKLPDDRAFQAYTITSISGVVAALEKAGVGFGKPGAKPGKFYSFSPPPASATVTLQNNSPM
jgi:hypothetical protein